MKVIDSMWFNTMLGHFGLVVGENSLGERNLYGGVVSGLDQKADEKAILDWGHQANIDMMEGLIAKTKSCTKANPCCDRRGEYHGYGQEPLKSCPTKCICHSV